MGPILILALVFAAFLMIAVMMAIRVVPQQVAYVIERWGKYDRTLTAGMHTIFPFMDRVAYKHTLKELVLDIPEQLCITRDNVQINVDGVVFLRVMDPSRASYGVSNYQLAIIQLAQTTLRSELGKLDLDRTFEERETINHQIVASIDKASEPWGVKILRYEVRSIQPPKDVVEAMEKQMRAEREKRAKILESEGERDSRINFSEGQKQETIKASEAQKVRQINEAEGHAVATIRASEADKQRSINEAEGQALALVAVAKATAQGLTQVASALAQPGGDHAARLRVAEEWVKQFGRLAKASTTMIVPETVSDVSAMLSSAFAVLDRSRHPPPSAP